MPILWVFETDVFIAQKDFVSYTKRLKLFFFRFAFTIYYVGILEVTRGDRGLQGVTGSYKGLQEVTRRDRGLQGVTGGLKRLQRVTGA